LLEQLHSPDYRVENAEVLPQTRAALESSAALGGQVTALLDVETPVHGVIQGSLREDLQTIAVLTTTVGGTPDFTLNVNCGYVGKGNAVMLGPRRVPESDGLLAVYLNDTTCWRDVPGAYTLGGYPVLKKRLSPRETAFGVVRSRRKKYTSLCTSAAAAPRSWRSTQR
jgi:hypothetical protein